MEAADQACDLLRPLGDESVQRKDDFPVGVFSQERLKQVLLSPVQPPLKKAPWIFVRDEDVVDVHENAGMKDRQDIEDQVVDLAAELDRVRSVNEQNVAGAQLAELVPAQARGASFMECDIPLTPELMNSRG